MALDKTWDKVNRYFRKNSRDNWGDTKAIDDEHLLRLYDFRKWLGVPIHVTHGVKTTGHSTKSYHYPRKDKEGILRAYATDIVIPKYKSSPFDLILDATRFGFTGIGYYPHWRWDGVIVGGLHLDSRPLKWDPDETKNYSHSRWLGVLNDEGKQVYIGLSFENLLEYSNYGVTENFH